MVVSIWIAAALTAIGVLVGGFVGFACGVTGHHLRQVRTVGSDDSCGLDEDLIVAQQRAALYRLDQLRQEAPGVARMLDRRAGPAVERIRQRVEARA